MFSVSGENGCLFSLGDLKGGLFDLSVVHSGTFKELPSGTFDSVYILGKSAAMELVKHLNSVISELDILSFGDCEVSAENYNKKGVFNIGNNFKVVITKGTIFACSISLRDSVFANNSYTVKLAPKDLLMMRFAIEYFIKSDLLYSFEPLRVWIGESGGFSLILNSYTFSVGKIDMGYLAQNIDAAIELAGRMCINEPIHVDFAGGTSKIVNARRLGGVVIVDDCPPRSEFDNCCYSVVDEEGGLTTSFN